MSFNIHIEATIKKTILYLFFKYLVTSKYFVSLLLRGPSGLSLCLGVVVRFSSGWPHGQMCKSSTSEEHPGIPGEDPSWHVEFKRPLQEVALVLRAVVCTDPLSLALGEEPFLHFFVFVLSRGLAYLALTSPRQEDCVFCVGLFMRNPDSDCIPFEVPH